MWKFKNLTLGDPERDPHEVEFFHLTDVAEAVVREFIQNSLDAKCDEKAIIRISFEKVLKENIKIFFKNIDNHLKATNFYPPEYSQAPEIAYLTLEDFGTTGLDGATGEGGQRPEGKNNFYNFWWYEGKSQKTGKERGRWGLGKTTFHVASRMRLFWGFTIRQDDKRKLLMGKALLKTHKLDSETFTYNGYYTDNYYTPFSNEELIEKFKKDFALLRDEEPGFSIVIPFPHFEITPSAILKSIIVHYFFPILNGSLEIMLRYNGKEEELNFKNLVEIASQQDWDGTSWDKVNVENLLEFVNSAIKKSSLLELTISDPENPEITKESFQEHLENIREEFNKGNIISVRVPVEIKEMNHPSINSYFDIYIQKKEDNTSADEYYVRSGITISDIKLISTYPVRSLFLAEDDAIAKFLGDAETPAHTDWNERTEGFNERYLHARRKLRFIKRKGLISILNYIYLPPKEQKSDFLKELFYVNVESQNEPDKEDGTPSKVSEPIPQSKQKKYQLIKISSGFKLQRNKIEITPPLKLKINCAYDTRKGNPFKNYEPFDFDLSSSVFNTILTGCTIDFIKENIVEIIIENKDFHFEITGFDTLRDLIVDIKEIES